MHLHPNCPTPSLCHGLSECLFFSRISPMGAMLCVWLMIIVQVDAYAHGIEFTLPPSALGPYKELVAVQMLHFASATYCTAEAIEGWNCSQCAALPHLTHVHVVEDPSMQTLGYVGLDKAGLNKGQRQQIVVAFRGTVNADIKNWISDFTITHISPWPSLPAVKVHQGFWNAWESLQPGIRAAVQEVLNVAPKAQVSLTGHSLGGAMAALCAFDLARAGTAIGRVITFGQPRVGNQHFAALYGSLGFRTWRLMHNRDPVPQLPFSRFDYAHVGSAVWYNEANSLHKVCTGGEDPQCQQPFDLFNILPSDHTKYLNMSTGDGSCTPHRDLSGSQ